MGKHDALNYLPSTRILEFPRRCAIYEPTRATSRLYLVLAGRVKLFSTAETGAQTLLRIVGAEEFFGEAALVPSDSSFAKPRSRSTRYKRCAGPPEEVQERVEKEPRLALALCEYFGRHNALLRERITTIANYKTGPRVMFALVQLARSNGSTTPQGAHADYRTDAPGDRRLRRHVTGDRHVRAESSRPRVCQLLAAVYRYLRLGALRVDAPARLCACTTEPRSRRWSRTA